MTEKTQASARPAAQVAESTPKRPPVLTILDPANAEGETHAKLYKSLEDKAVVHFFHTAD